MKVTTLLLIFVFVPFFVFSQANLKPNFKIKGSIIDSASAKGIPFVTISVYKEPGKIVYKRLATEEGGKFEGAIKDTGEFSLTANLIGYAPFSNSFKVSGSDKLLDLGEILLSEAVQTLNEVSIIADKPLIKVDADKISYSAESDPESKTTNVLDMLRKVPLVTVDGDDNIQLKGASNFKIFINGKPSTMLSNNPGCFEKHARKYSKGY
jgi:hypothetical protein